MAISVRGCISLVHKTFSANAYPLRQCKKMNVLQPTDGMGSETQDERPPARDVDVLHRVPKRRRLQGKQAPPEAYCQASLLHADVASTAATSPCATSNSPIDEARDVSDSYSSESDGELMVEEEEPEYVEGASGDCDDAEDAADGGGDCVRCAHRMHCHHIYDGRSTRCCRSCAKTHDPEWYTAYVAASRCERCKGQYYAANVYDGRSTRCCISCAKTHDPKWYAAYIAARRCEQCKEQMFANQLYDARSTRCCVSCAKTHAPSGTPPT
jgi:hypothetical protein